MRDTPIRFKAILAPVQSSIKISGDGNGARIMFDIPETELVNALELLACRNVVLNVTVEVALRSEVVSSFEDLIGAIEIPDLDMSELSL